MSDAKLYAAAGVMGAVAGMRSMTAPAVLSQFARAGLPVPGGRLAVLASGRSSNILPLFALGEIIADKLPFLPKRTKAPSLVWRAVSGAVSGALICSAKKRPALPGILIGAAAAVGASYAFYELRKKATQDLHIPDPIVALAEDTLAAGAGAYALNSLRED